MLTATAAPVDTRPTAWTIHVRDLGQARAFYGELLGCRESAPADRALSFDFFGTRLAVWMDESCAPEPGPAALDVCLALPQWRNLAQRLMAAGTRFEVPPHCHHEGRVDECWTLSIRDPSGNALAIRASGAAPRWH
ncbi:glyoxalase [Mitsuaria sp. WAJ17]|uniref:VOC family protein n=1 Tax=Mitsuaria sp. WAJ17 TaxID=2761452 RepID=UPI001600C9D1|nr:VOC family protein [Mitsuaria sp. WAJ17]MBB2487343.1 glyoxalase [Mitsuaria sp. WAJ17]